VGRQCRQAVNPHPRQKVGQAGAGNRSQAGENASGRKAGESLQAWQAEPTEC